MAAELRARLEAVLIEAAQGYSAAARLEVAVRWEIDRAADDEDGPPTDLGCRLDAIAREAVLRVGLAMALLSGNRK